MPAKSKLEFAWCPIGKWGTDPFKDNEFIEV